MKLTNAALESFLVATARFFSASPHNVAARSDVCMFF